MEDGVQVGRSGGNAGGWWLVVLAVGVCLEKQAGAADPGKNIPEQRDPHAVKVTFPA